MAVAGLGDAVQQSYFSLEQDCGDKHGLCH